MLINDPNQEPCRLAPLEAFSNELAPKELRQQLLPEREPNQIEVCSETVSRVFASRCAGDVKPPTAAELYHAMQQKAPNEREDSVLCSWVIHATIDDLWWAWSERAYSWRMLARAMQRVELPWWEAYRYVNAHAERQEMVPDDAFPVVSRRTASGHGATSPTCSPPGGRECASDTPSSKGVASPHGST